MTFSLILFVVSLVVAAVAASTFLWTRFSSAPPRFWEKCASIAVLAFAIAIAVNWLLSWFHLLDRLPLLLLSIVLGVLGAMYLKRVAIEGLNLRAQTRPDVLWLLPLLLWIGFVLWRGAILPVLSHDALAYHLPKAVMLARAHHYEFFDAPDPRIGTSPPNYEMLLADVLLLSGSDAYTEWIGTASFIALLLLAAALAQRWWGSGTHVVITILLSAAVPVILLHAGAHKNDLLANVFYVAIVLWGGRWLSSQDGASLALMLVSGAAAAGTKVQSAFPLAAMMAVAIAVLLRGRLRISRKQVVMIAVAVPMAILLFGAWSYVVNLRRTGQAALPASSSSDAGYGDWSNLLELPAMTLLRPFDKSDADLYVPWRGERWFWPRFELYFSDFGRLVTILVLILPLTVLRYRATGTPSLRQERILTSVAAAIALFLMFPIKLRPLGFFAGFPRYFAFSAIFVILWTVIPLVSELALTRKRLAVQAFAAASAALFIYTAFRYTVFDSFQPLNYVVYVSSHPGLRIPFFARYRAATVVDRMAAPDDTIAIHAGFDSWIYPLYGPTLQRKVIFLDPQKPIPPEARYVIVDRNWNIMWGDPKFKNAGQYEEYLTQGKPTEEDLAIVKRLFADPRTYEPVYTFGPRNQAVFMRRDWKPAARPSSQRIE